MRPYKTKSNQGGYMAIEMMTTIITAALFIVAFYQLFTVINNSYVLSRNEAIANTLTYNYLRKYNASNPPVNWFVCDPSTNTSTNTNDLTINPNASGQIIESGTLSNESSKLPGTVTFSVVGLSVYGCNGTNTQSPIRIAATVTYGNNITTKHTTMVGY